MFRTRDYLPNQFRYCEAHLVVISVWRVFDHPRSRYQQGQYQIIVASLTEAPCLLV